MFTSNSKAGTAFRFSAIFFLLTVFLLSACGGSDSAKNEPDTDAYINPADFLYIEAAHRGFAALPYMSETSLSDFNLAPQPDYFEVRVYTPSTSATEDNSEYYVQYEFDAGIKAQFSEAEMMALQEVTSEYGYDVGCQPMYCTIYIVSMYEQSAVAIDNQPDLMGFLGEVDMPAELNFVFTSGESARYFKDVDSGFEVLTSWHDCNGGSGVNLWHVDKSGNSILLENLLEQDDGPVC